jgi:hypothetical protein
MLTESNLHLLAEEGLISKEKVLEAIKRLLELAHGDDQTASQRLRGEAP